MRPASLLRSSIAALLIAGCSFSPAGSPVDAMMCVPGCSADSGELITCAPDRGAMRTPCLFGCVDDGGAPACATRVVPSNVDLPMITLFPIAAVGAELLTVAGQRTAVDTDTGTIWQTTPGVLTSVRTGEGISNNMGFQKISSTLSVLMVKELDVVEGSTLEAFGTRSLVILVPGPVKVAGRVRADGGICDSVMSRPGCRGAGGGWGGGELSPAATGCAAGGNGVTGLRETGGGGGGMATAGGAGGTSGTSAGGTAGIEGGCGDERLVPLVGGGGGGKSGFGNTTGGGGGGALQITSLTSVQLASTAVVSAVGAGGEGTATNNNGGGGGGGGGAILLEAPTVTVDPATVISTAGGGGGGGRVTGRPGQAGRTDGTPALGGAGDGPNMTDGLGGNGAIDSSAALPGSSNPAGDLDGTGGGGGGLGRIRINSVKADAAEGTGFVGRFTAGRTGRARP